MGATKREVAEQLGVAKQTIVNYIAKLDLSDHIERVGKTDVLDEFAVSAIAHAVGKSIPQTSAPKEDGVTTSDAVVSMLNERIADLKAELESERMSHAREVESLREQLAEANGKAVELAGRLANIAERQQVIAATPWWKRGRMAMRLLGPGDDND